MHSKILRLLCALCVLCGSLHADSIQVIGSNGSSASVSVTGSGAPVLANGPTLAGPTLGSAVCTAINGLVITTTTGGHITIASGKTLTASNTLTLTGTDGSTLAIGTGGTLGTAAYTAATAYQAASGGTLTISSGKTFTASNTLTLTGTDGSSLAIGAGGTAVTTAGTQTLTNKTLTAPTLTTPALGVATATSLNGLTITTSTGTLTIASGKTLTASNTLTLAGTDSSTLNIGTGGTLGTAAYTAASTYPLCPHVAQAIAAQSFTVASGSWVDITNLTITYTPTSASNHVLVTCVINGGYASSSVGTVFRVVRDGTMIVAPTITGSAFQAHAGIGNANIDQQGSCSFLLDDFPADTSSHVWKVQGSVISGGTGTGWVNASGETNQAYDTVVVSTLMIQEHP